MIRLSTFQDRKYETIKNISQSCFDEIQLDSETLKNAYTQFIIFKHLQLNLNEYSNFLKKISDIPNATLDIQKIQSQNLLLQANRIILNFLSSFKFFLDNGESYLKRNFGKNSIISTEFITLTRYQFDNVFAYRFLSKLRNYSLHLGFPLQSLGFKTELNKESPEKMIGSLQLEIDIDLIKKERQLLGSIVYNDIKDLKSNIDLKPLIYDLSISILEIQKYIYSVQKDSIENSISNLETFTRDYKTIKNDIKVFNNYHEEGETITFDAYHIPFEIIAEFKRYKKTGGNKELS